MGSKAGHQERQIVVCVDDDGGRGNGVTGRAQQQMTPPPPPTHSLTACAHSLLIREAGNLVRGSYMKMPTIFFKYL